MHSTILLNTGILSMFLSHNTSPGMVVWISSRKFIPDLCSVLGLIEADCGRLQKHSWDHLLYTRKTSARLLMRSTKYKGNDIILIYNLAYTTLLPYKNSSQTPIIQYTNT